MRSAKLYSTKRLVEAGEVRGHEMLVIDHTRCNIEIEKKKPQTYFKGEMITDAPAIFILRIGGNRGRYGKKYCGEIIKCIELNTLNDD